MLGLKTFESYQEGYMSNQNVSHDLNTIDSLVAERELLQSNEKRFALRNDHAAPGSQLVLRRRSINGSHCKPALGNAPAVLDVDDNHKCPEVLFSDSECDEQIYGSSTE